MDAMESAFTPPSIDRIPGQAQTFELSPRHDAVLMPRDLS
jgi:hypothetical protein